MNRKALAAGSVIAVAFLARVAAACSRPPWHDEYFTVWAAGLPLADLLAALRLDSGPPLPYLLVKLLAVSGLAPLAAARTVSVLAGAAAVVLAARAARSAFGERAALICCALVAFHPLALASSSEGRAYGLLFLASTWAWERVETLRRTGRGASGLATAVGLACWSHGLGPAVGAAAAAASLSLPPSTRPRSLTGAGVGLLSFLPWLPVSLGQPAAATAWMHAAWRGMPFPERLAAPVRLVPPVGPFARTVDLPAFADTWGVAVAVLCTALLVVARPSWTTAAMAVVPAVGLPLLAELGAPAFYPGRAEALFLAPVLAILASSAARGTRWWCLGAALAAAAACATTFAIWHWRASPVPPEELVAARIAERHPEGAVVVATGYWWLDLDAALEPHGSGYGVVAYPACVAKHPGWFDPATCLPAADESARLFDRLASADGRTALFLSPGTPGERQLRALVERFALRPALAVPGGVLFLPTERRQSPH